jgi:membrane protein required for colicin V production
MLDVFILILLLVGAIQGYFNGFIIQTATFLAIVAGIWGSAKLNFFFTPLITKLFGMEPRLSRYIAFVIAFIAIIILVELISRLLTKAIDKSEMGTINRLAGLLAGIFKALFIISLILFLIQKLDKKNVVLKPTVLEQSFLAGPVSAFAPSILPNIDYERVKHGILGK